MVILEQIRKNLVSAIRESGLSQTELARRLNIKQPTVGQYISGRAMPALDTFANLCIILDIDPADILCTNDSGAKEKAVRVSDSFNNNSGSINFKA